MAHATVRQRVVRVALDGRWAVRPDTLAVEEPLEIRVDDAPFTVTMRTPGHDLDLALGLLVAEGTLNRPEDVASARGCPDAARDADGLATHNVVTVDLAPGVRPPEAVRHRLASSACGICGSASIEAVRTRSRHDLTTDDVRIDATVLAG